MLLGLTGAGKSASGNTIINGNEKPFKEDYSPPYVKKVCQSEQTVVDRQKITVIDTVGLSETSVKKINVPTEIEKMLQSANLDVFLLVITLEIKFTEVKRNIVTWIQENFGTEVLKHTIVLFTHADQLHEPIEHYLSECQALRSVVDQCSGRFHVFNNKNEDRTQVTELMKKIECLRRMNKSKRYTEQDYAKAQKDLLHKKGATGAAVGREAGNLRIILLGKSGSGKSSAGNTILGREYFNEAVSPESITKTCEIGEAQIDNQIVSVIDTPGLFDTQMSEEQMKAEIERCVYMSVPGPHAFLLVIRLGVRFTDEEKNTVQWIKENFGEEAAHYTIILFTHADDLNGKPLDEYISESNDVQALVTECNSRYHLFNNKDMENHSQVSELKKKIENMVRMNEEQHYTNEMYKQAQKKMKWDGIKQTIINCGKTALILGGGAVGVTATMSGAATGIGIGVAGGGAAAIARGAVAAAARGAVASVGKAAVGGAAAAAAKAKLGL